MEEKVSVGGESRSGGRPSSNEDCTDFDNFYRLEDNAMFWTGVEMCSDVFGLILGFCYPWLVPEFFGVEANSDSWSVFNIHLILSFLVNAGVVWRKRYDKPFFTFSLVKGALFLIPCGVIIGNWKAHLDNEDHRDIDLGTLDIDVDMDQEQITSIQGHDPTWPWVASFFTVLIGIKGIALRAHFSLHSFLVRAALKGQFKVTPTGQRGHHQLPSQPQPQPRPHQTDVENPLEDFYVRKTANLHHNLLMKETYHQFGPEVAPTAKKVTENWTENFYIDPKSMSESNTEITTSNKEPTPKDKKNLRRDKVWILSNPGKDKFLTREVAFPLEGGKYVIFDGQIVL